jgi:hypothetical protein
MINTLKKSSKKSNPVEFNKFFWWGRVVRVLHAEEINDYLAVIYAQNFPTIETFKIWTPINLNLQDERISISVDEVCFMPFNRDYALKLRRKHSLLYALNLDKTLTTREKKVWKSIHSSSHFIDYHNKLRECDLLRKERLNKPLFYKDYSKDLTRLEKQTFKLYQRFYNSLGVSR